VIAFGAFSFVKKYGCRAHERKDSSAIGVFNLAVIFALSVVSAEVLLGLDRPVASNYPQKCFLASFLRGYWSSRITIILAFLVDIACAQVLNAGVQAKDLSGSSQTDGGAVDLQTPEFTLGYASVFFVRRAGLRGEYFRA